MIRSADVFAWDIQTRLREYMLPVGRSFPDIVQAGHCIFRFEGAAGGVLSPPPPAENANPMGLVATMI